MKIGAENKKKLMTLGGLGVVLIAALVYAGSSFFGGGSSHPAAPPPPAAPAAAHGGAAAPKASAPAGKDKPLTAADLDPTLRMGGMKAAESLEYSGSGRNIFSASSVPVGAAIPDPVASARAAAQAAAAAALPTGPAPPPPIDLKYFGVVTSGDGKQRAFLLNGDSVFMASEGDIVQRRYKIVTISAKTVMVEDMTNNNRQSLPRTSN